MSRATARIPFERLLSAVAEATASERRSFEPSSIDFSLEATGTPGGPARSCPQ